MWFEDRVPAGATGSTLQTRENTVLQAQESRRQRHRLIRQKKAAEVLHTHYTSLKDLKRHRRELLKNENFELNEKGCLKLESHYSGLRSISDLLKFMNEVLFVSSKVRIRLRGERCRCLFVPNTSQRVNVAIDFLSDLIGRKLRQHRSSFFEETPKCAFPLARMLELAAFHIHRSRSCFDLLSAFLLHGASSMSQEVVGELETWLGASFRFHGLLLAIPELGGRNSSEIYLKCLEVSMRSMKGESKMKYSLARGLFGSDYAFRASRASRLVSGSQTMREYFADLLLNSHELHEALVLATSDSQLLDPFIESEMSVMGGDQGARALLSNYFALLRSAVSPALEGEGNTNYGRKEVFRSICQLLRHHFEFEQEGSINAVLLVMNLLKRFDEPSEGRPSDNILFDLCSDLHYIIEVSGSLMRERLSYAMVVSGFLDQLGNVINKDNFKLPTPSMMRSTWKSPIANLRIFQVFLFGYTTFVTKTPMTKSVYSSINAVKVVQYLRDCISSMAVVEGNFSAFVSENPFLSSAIRLFSALYDRSKIEAGCVIEPQHFLRKTLKMSTKEERERLMDLFKFAPFVVSLDDRIAAFLTIIMESRSLGRGEEQPNVRIRRNNLVSDAFQQFSRIEKANGIEVFRRPLNVDFISHTGAREPAFGHGVTKEFLTEVALWGFKKYGLFKEANGELFPRPHIPDEDWESKMRFLGVVLGKSIFEGVLVDVPFARFFLKKLVGAPIGLSDFYVLDRVHYKHLAALTDSETYSDKQLADLGLTMSVDEESYDMHYTVDLIEGGRDVPVTRENVVQYVHLFVDFKLRKQISRQTEAFLDGFSLVIDPEWMSMFTADELQDLISGRAADLDVEDLRKNTKYTTTDYNEDKSKTIKWFWEVVRELTAEQQKKFLKFVTSIEKSPLLGFESLQPPFTVQMGGDDTELLPTASTCANLLKLPPYRSKSKLKEKLLHAIQEISEFGFS